eukprot:828751-Rhodomonas_salina.3
MPVRSVRRVDLYQYCLVCQKPDLKQYHTVASYGVSVGRCVSTRHGIAGVKDDRRDVIPIATQRRGLL